MYKELLSNISFDIICLRHFARSQVNMEIKVRGRVPPSPPRLVITINDLRNMVSPFVSASILGFYSFCCFCCLFFCLLSGEFAVVS